MAIVANAPTAGEVLSRLQPGGSESTVLAEVVRGPFTARVTRWNAKDGTDAYSDEPRIEIDCSDQDGGEMFVDLTILPHNADDFSAVTAEIVADYRALTQTTSNENTPDARQGASGVNHPNPTLTKETN